MPPVMLHVGMPGIRDQIWPLAFSVFDPLPDFFFPLEKPKNSPKKSVIMSSCYSISIGSHESLWGGNGEWNEAEISRLHQPHGLNLAGCGLQHSVTNTNTAIT